MSPHLCARLLALPPTIRDALARVDGPGFSVRPPWTEGAQATTDALGVCPDLRYLPAGSAWLPANPAAAVAAVLDCTLAAAHESLMAWLDNHEDIEHPNAPGLDSDAALSIIEAHAARSQS